MEPFFKKNRCGQRLKPNILSSKGYQNLESPSEVKNHRHHGLPGVNLRIIKTTNLVVHFRSFSKARALEYQNLNFYKSIF